MADEDGIGHSMTRASLVPGLTWARWAWSRHSTTRHAPGMIVPCLGLESGTVARHDTTRFISRA